MLIHAEGAVPVDSTTVGYCWEKSEKKTVILPIWSWGKLSCLVITQKLSVASAEGRGIEAMKENFLFMPQF